MPTSSEGIVLRKIAYSSSSSIVTIYTHAFGQTPFMVRGIGKKGGRSAALQPLTRVVLVCNFREKNQVQTLTSLELKSESSQILNPLKASIALFLAEILLKSLREESADQELYEFLDSSIDYFVNDRFSPNFHLVFLLKLCRFFGFFPSGH